MSTSVIGMREVVDGLALPLILAGALAVYGVLFGWRGRDAEAGGRGELRGGGAGLMVPGWAVFLWVWQLVAFAAVTIGPGRRVHYWAVALLPLMMLAGYAVHLVMSSGRDGGSRRPMFHVVVAVVWFGYMLFGPLAAQWRAVHVYHYHYVEGDDSRYRRVGEIVEANSGPEASVFVWGYDPQMYWRLNRPIGARYLVLDQLMNPGRAAVELFERVVESVEDGRPEILVMDESLLAKMEAGDWNGGRMTGCEDFAGWVRSNYVIVGGDGSGTVWRLRG